MKNTKTWVVVASSAQAKVFEAHMVKFLKGEEDLTLIKEYQHPESRQHDSQRVSDKLGNYHGKNEGHGSFVESSDPKHHESEVFALTLVRDLETARLSESYENIILVVPPAFYGHINKCLHPSLKKQIVRVIEKDYTKESVSVLEAHLRQQIG